MYDNQKRRRPEHDKFTSPEFERQQQRQRTDDPAEGLPERLRGRVNFDQDLPADAEQQAQDRPGSSFQQDPAALRQQQGSQQNNSGGGRRIEFNLDKAQPPPENHLQPRVSSKYGSKEDPPVLKRLSGLSDRLAVRDTAVDTSSREQQRGEGSGRRQLSPERGPTGRDRERERARIVDRDRDRERERERARGRDSVQRRAPAVERLRDSSRDRPRARSRDEAPARSMEPSRDRSRPAGRELSRERSRDRVVQGSRDRGRDYSPSRAAGARDEPARVSGRDSSRAREGDREQRPAAKDAHNDGFARPQPRAPTAQQPHGRPRFTAAQWAEINKADAMLASVRARHAGLVEQQLKHLILTQPLATGNVWDKVCQAANMPSELLDGPLVAVARRSDCDHALMSRASAHLMPPLDPTVPSTLEAVGEDVYIQQLQALINRYEQQSAAPHCAEVWALQGAGQKGKRAAGQAQAADERVSYSLLLPAELKGLLWGIE